MLQRLLTEIRLSSRTLVKAGSFSLAAVGTLSLAMTICMVTLVVVNAYLLQGLPYPQAERLYDVRYARPGLDAPPKLETLDWRSLDDIIEHPIAWDLDVFYLLGGERAEAAPGAWVTPGFVAGLGIAPAIGRAFDEHAFAPGGPNVALISHRLWRARFGGADDVVGRDFSAYVSDRPEEAETFTIIGVLPQNFWHVNTYTDVLVPLRAPTFPYMVRLRPGVTPTEAAARVTSLVRAGTAPASADWRAELVKVRDRYLSQVRPVLRAVTVAASLVWLVTWANVAGLMLVRAMRRRREIAVRSALGASRTSIVQLLLVEAVLLGLCATAVGVALTRMAIGWFGPLVQRELGSRAPGGIESFQLDISIVAAAAGATIATAVICAAGVYAASWRFASGDAGASRGVTDGVASRRVRSGLVVMEVATALALLVGASLMVQTAVRLARTGLGIDVDTVITAQFSLRQQTYPSDAHRVAVFERLLATIAAAPGIDGVGLSSSWPLQARQPRPVESRGPGGVLASRVSLNAVSSEYFASLRIRLINGRVFTSDDRPGGESVAIISETAAHRLWPNGDAVGQRLFVSGEENASSSDGRTVVGVVGDVRQDPTDTDLADVYLPFLQSPGRFAVMYVRGSAEYADVSGRLVAAVKEVDAEIALSTPRPLGAVLDERLSRPNFLASLLGGLSFVAVALALIGVYGVIAYGVRQREREIAVRMAIGAGRANITGMFLRQGGRLLLVGIVLGCLGAAFTGRILESQLFGVQRGDPFSVASAAAALSLAGVLAIWWPARRAAATDPALALREE